MNLLVRVYFHAIFGALGGLIGWMLFGVLGEKNAALEYQRFQQILGGLLIGASIGYCTVGVEGLRERSFVRVCRMSALGAAFGGVSGALGIWAGDHVNFLLLSNPGASTPWGRTARTIIARALAWMILGAAVGACHGLAARAARKALFGVVGGALGGFCGGVLLGTLLAGVSVSSHAYVWGQALGLMFVGACIGAMTAAVQTALGPARLIVTRGGQKGREFSLLNAVNSIGRDEFADITLYYDSQIAQRHAIIRHEGGKYFIANQDAQPSQTRVNGQILDQPRLLKDNDRIECGGIELRFRARTP